MYYIIEHIAPDGARKTMKNETTPGEGTGPTRISRNLIESKKGFCRNKSSRVSAILWFNCWQPDVDDLTIQTRFAIRLVHEIDITRRNLAFR
jgi:hypothetical protein